LIWIQAFSPQFFLLKTPDIFFYHVNLECNWT
jgi:hypothetical protein